MTSTTTIRTTATKYYYCHHHYNNHTSLASTWTFQTLGSQWIKQQSKLTLLLIHPPSDLSRDIFSSFFRQLDRKRWEEFEECFINDENLPRPAPLLPPSRGLEPPRPPRMLPERGNLYQKKLTKSPTPMELGNDLELQLLHVHNNFSFVGLVKETYGL